MDENTNPETVLKRIFDNLNVLETDLKLYNSLMNNERIKTAYMNDEAFGIAKKVHGDLKSRPDAVGTLIDLDKWMAQLNHYEAGPTYESRMKTIVAEVNKIRIVNGQRAYGTLRDIYSLEDFFKRNKPEMLTIIETICKLFERKPPPKPPIAGTSSNGG